MIDLTTIRVMLEYTDWGNTRLLESAAGLTDELLDRDLQIGLGSLRRIMIHTASAEDVWLQRWQGRVETPWPDESQRRSLAQLGNDFARIVQSRNAWLDTLKPGDLARAQTYRDSRGSLFQATLGDMLLQSVMHTKHHQAQAVNAVRRLGGQWPELDYMTRVRRSAN